MNDDGTATFYVRDDSDLGLSATGSTVVADSTWHHVAGVLDRGSNTMALFVDGASEATTSIAGFAEVNDGGSPLEIGRVFAQGWGSPSSYFTGMMDDVRIYDRALSGVEVEQLTAVPIPAALYLFTSALLGFGILGYKKECS